MIHPLNHVCWPVSKLGEAIDALARRSGLSPRSGGIPNPPLASSDRDAGSLARWIEMSVERLGLEAEAVECAYAEVERFVLGAGPAIVRMPGAGEPRFVALFGGRGRSVSLLAPDLRVHKIRAERFGAALCGEIEAPVAADVDRILEEIHVPRRRRERVRTAVLRERLGGRRIGGAGCSACDRAFHSGSRHAMRDFIAISSRYSAPIASTYRSSFWPGGSWGRGCSGGGWIEDGWPPGPCCCSRPSRRAFWPPGFRAVLRSAPAVF